ncbi:MAG: histone deacetylase [Anaerolineae bacterium]|nr:histone deacetylase [Anaerolineae bacterium]
MSTAYVYDPSYLEHNRPGHVECRERLETTIQVLDQRGLLEKLAQIQPAPVPAEHLLAVHHEHYVKLARDVAERGGGNLDSDTYLNGRSYEVALLAAGGLLNLVDAILDGKADNGFALVRPPGHHALPGRGMGFCLFNNVAVAAQYALKHRGLSRILIADFDLHHGNGTQEMFYTTDSVMYFSTHQYPYYPGTGHWSEIGAAAGEGFTVNVPLLAGVGDEGYERIFDEILYPIAERYLPEFILVSAGFDAHWRDPLGMMQVSAAGYGSLAGILKQMADELCDGRLAFTLEGGYDLQGLAHSIAAVLQALLGEDIDDPLGPSPRPSTSVDDMIIHVKGVHRLV